VKYKKYYIVASVKKQDAGKQAGNIMKKSGMMLPSSKGLSCGASNRML